MNYSAMEPEPEDEEQARAAAAAAEAQGESTAADARVDVAGHEVSANSTALDVSGWGLAAAQVWEVARALPQLFYLQELVLDGVPVSGTTPRRGDFRRGVETLDANLDMFRVLCEALRALQGLTSLSLGGCYLGPKALALLAEVVFRDASAVVARLSLNGNMITGSSKDRWGTWTYDKDLSGFIALCDALLTLKNPIELDLSNCGLSVNGVNPVAKAISAGAVIN